MAGTLWYDVGKKMYGGEVRIQDGTERLGEFETQAELEMAYLQSELVLNHAKPSDLKIPGIININLRPDWETAVVTMQYGVEFKVGDKVKVRGATTDTRGVVMGITIGESVGVLLEVKWAFKSEKRRRFGTKTILAEKVEKI